MLCAAHRILYVARALCLVHNLAIVVGRDRLSQLIDCGFRLVSYVEHIACANRLGFLKDSENGADQVSDKNEIPGLFSVSEYGQILLVTRLPHEHAHDTGVRRMGVLARAVDVKEATK